MTDDEIMEELVRLIQPIVCDILNDLEISFYHSTDVNFCTLYY